LPFFFSSANKNINKSNTNKERFIKASIIQNVTKQEFISKKFLKLNNLTEQQCFDIVNENTPTCQICSINKPKFISWKHGYHIICIDKVCKKALRAERTKKTNLEKYGVENISQLDSIKQLKSDTLFGNFGTRDFLNSEANSHTKYDENGKQKAWSESSREMRDATNMERYGTTDIFSINGGREKALEKIKNDPEIRLRAQKTCMERYGVPFSFMNEEVKDKIKETCIERYGSANHMLNDAVKAKHTKSNAIAVINKLNDIDENGNNAFQRAGVKGNDKRRETNENNGNWITEDQVENFKDYAKLVWRYTRANDLSVLENIENRGTKTTDYHLDHRYSIFQGFRDDVPAKIIGSIDNLEMLQSGQNLSKNKKCSITLKELVND